MDPKTFRTDAAKHAERALTVAAEIMNDTELSPVVRLEAGKWLTKVADLEPKAHATEGNDKFSIIINFDDRTMPFGAPHIEHTGGLSRLLEDEPS